jgi:hypothetical protein
MRPQSVPQQAYMNPQSVPQQHTSAQQYYDHQQVNQPQVSPQAYPNAAVNEQTFHQGQPNNPYFNPQSAQQVYHPQQPSAFSPVQPNSRQL